MGNVTAKELNDRELGQAYLDSSSNKLIHSRCVTNDITKLIQKRKTWYYVSKRQQHDDDDDDHPSTSAQQFVFAIQKRKYFDGTTQVIVDDEDCILAVLQTKKVGKSTNKTLVYRTCPTFDGQDPTMEVYKESELKKKKNAKEVLLPKLYLFARIQSSGISKCDATYALLQVDVVYNDPDFAKFQDPPLYRAAKVTGGSATTRFSAAVMDGCDPAGGETLLGKVTSTEAELANGVDMIATICLALSVNQSGSSARGVGSSGVV